MRQRQIEYPPRTRTRAETPCWREILDQAFSGLTSADQQLERMLDYLERGR